jgi:MerR family copper efflux transcriptional regulator
MAVTDQQLMTVGELSRRTGLSIKAIREYEGLGLIYSAGRSEGGYRMFDESAVWCAEVIGELRALGLTIKEIKRIGDSYLSNPDEPIGPLIAAALDRTERRIEKQLAELQAIRSRMRAFRNDNAAALAARPGTGLFSRDPRRQTA